MDHPRKLRLLIGYGPPPLPNTVDAFISIVVGGFGVFLVIV